MGNDGSIRAQGFFCGAVEGSLHGNTMNMAVVQIGDHRIVWKRPPATFRDDGARNCEDLTFGHKHYMEMFIDGERIRHDDIPDEGFSNSVVWAKKLHLSPEEWNWGRMEQRNMCLGTHDRKLTILRHTIQEQPVLRLLDSSGGKEIRTCETLATTLATSSTW